MEAMRKSWTDERLDDFAAHTDRRFDTVDRRFDEVDRRFDEVDRRFQEVDRRFDRVEVDLREIRGEMNTRFEHLDGRVDDINRTIFRLGSGAIITFVVGFAGLIATQL